VIESCDLKPRVECGLRRSPVVFFYDFANEDDFASYLLAPLPIGMRGQREFGVWLGGLVMAAGTRADRIANSESSSRGLRCTWAVNGVGRGFCDNQKPHRLSKRLSTRNQDIQRADRLQQENVEKTKVKRYLRP
jgi:hypothetical protein